ncbi:uncharacterized protein [Asterias amurensis]|uniref:uncharacterized protein n=1 Tax=Asterias amurensis TaxID=7602 RepID=UPI003AB29736
MASMEDYTEGLRASLNQRMEHALNDNTVKVSDILSKTHAQMVADLTDPREWYYSDAHRYLIDLLHVNYGGSQRKGIRFQTNPNISSVDHTDSNKTKIKGHNVNYSKVERNMHVHHKRETTRPKSSKEPCFDGTDAMIRYRRQKALARNSKNAHGASKHYQQFGSETFAENTGNRFLPTHHRAQKVAEKQPTGLNELTVLPSTAAQEHSPDLTPPRHSETRAPAKQTKIRKFVFPPESQEKGSRHDSEVVVYDRWIQHIAGDKSLPETTYGILKKNDRCTGREKSIILQTPTNSKSTQTDGENGGGKVKLFSIPLKLSPNSGLHGCKRPHTSALKLKSSQGLRDFAKFGRARSPRNDTNFQSLLDNAKKRLAEIEWQLHGLCVESGIIHKSASTNAQVVRDSLTSQRADAADNLPGEDGGYSKTTQIKSVDVGTVTPSEWYTVSKPLKPHNSDVKTVNMKSYVTPWRNKLDSSVVTPDMLNVTSQHSRYQRHVTFAKSALIHPAKLVRPQTNQRWNSHETARENGSFATTSDLLVESLDNVDTSGEIAERVNIPSPKGIRNSQQEEELKMLLRTCSLTPSPRKQTAKNETSPEKGEFDVEILESTESNNSSFTDS